MCRYVHKKPYRNEYVLGFKGVNYYNINEQTFVRAGIVCNIPGEIITMCVCVTHVSHDIGDI